MVQVTADISRIITGGQTLAQAVGLTAEEVESLYAAGFRFFTQGRFRDAHPMLRLVALFDHTSERYWIALAACRQMMGDFLLAAESYVTAAGLNLPCPTSAIQAAFCLLRAGELPSAEVWLQEAERRASHWTREPQAMRKCRALRSAITKAAAISL